MVYLRPPTLDAALDALATGEPWTVLAGGTDHFPSRANAGHQENILDLATLPDLRRIERRDGSWLIPALATWSDVLAAPLPPAFDGLKQAARQVGGVQIQNAATVVGNVCNASPAADGIPCLLALDARVELQSVAERRVVRLADFLLGPRLTMRREDELVVGLHVPDRGGRAVFEKLGARRYLVISIAMVSIWAQIRGDIVQQCRVAVGACAPVARRLTLLEEDMTGRALDPRMAASRHLAPLMPIDDVRATAAYRQTAALELLRRAIAGLAA